MKKILILAYDFPPYVSVGGLRPYSWYKFLNGFDIEPIVITRQWANEFGNHLDYVSKSKIQTTTYEKTELGTIIRTPYRPNFANRLLIKYGDYKFVFIRKAITAFIEYAQFFFKTGPKIGLYDAAREYLSKNKVDAIIATGGPFILFQYASFLSNEFDIPWIADYRDPWTISNSKKLFSNFRPLSYYFERKIVKSATAISTVDEIFKRQILQIVGKKSVYIIPNGYDSESMSNVSSIPQGKDCMSIALVGSILKWNPINLVFSALSEFKKENPVAKIRLNLYGINDSEKIRLTLEKSFPELLNNVFTYPRIGNDELLSILAKNNLMLLFNYYSYTGTKIYDYLGIKRKILLCFSDDVEANKLFDNYYVMNENTIHNNHVQADMIKETNSGEVVKDVSHFKSVLKELYIEFRETGEIKCESVATEQFTRKTQAEKLANLIKEITH